MFTKKILSIETSSNVCGISLLENNKVISLVERKCLREHIEILPKSFKSLFERCDLSFTDVDALAVNIGPGSFTGLRIGLGFTKGLAYSKGLPIIPVPSLLSLAYSLRESKPFSGMCHSHNKMVYYQEFNWIDKIPYIIKKATIGSIDEFITNSNIGFQSNCDAILNKNTIINKAKPSAINIGLLASMFYDEWVNNKPYDLVPDYISQFKVGGNRLEKKD